MHVYYFFNTEDGVKTFKQLLILFFLIKFLYIFFFTLTTFLTFQSHTALTLYLLNVKVKDVTF